MSELGEGLHLVTVAIMLMDLCILINSIVIRHDLVEMWKSATKPRALYAGSWFAKKVTYILKGVAFVALLMTGSCCVCCTLTRGRITLLCVHDLSRCSHPFGPVLLVAGKRYREQVFLSVL